MHLWADNLQFVGAQEHDRVAAVAQVLPAVVKVDAPGSIGTLGTNRASLEEADGEHSLAADDGGPRGIALHPDVPVVTRLHVGVQVRNGLLAGQLLGGGAAGRPALVAAGGGSGGGAVGLGD